MSLKVGQEVWYVIEVMQAANVHAGRVCSCRVVAADADTAAVVSPFGVPMFLLREYLFVEKAQAERYAADVAKEKGWTA